MKIYTDYLTDACEALDRYSGVPEAIAKYQDWPTPNTVSLPTQMQSINLALIMAITDLIKVLEEKK